MGEGIEPKCDDCFYDNNDCFDIIGYCVEKSKFTSVIEVRNKLPEPPPKRVISEDVKRGNIPAIKWILVYIAIELIVITAILIDIASKLR